MNRLVQAIILMPSYMAKQERMVNQLKLSSKFLSVNDDEVLQTPSNDEDDHDDETSNASIKNQETTCSNTESPTPSKEKKTK